MAKISEQSIRFDRVCESKGCLEQELPESKSSNDLWQVMTKKVFNQLFHENLQNKFVEGTVISKYNTRNSMDLRVQRLKLEHNKKRFLYKCPKVWDSIPQPIRDTESIVQLKKA